MPVKSLSDKAKFWKKTIRRCEKSGSSITAFCRRYRISEAAFYRWRKNLSCRKDKSHFIPVQLTAPIIEKPGLIIYCPNGYRIANANYVDKAQLQEALLVIKEIK